MITHLYVRNFAIIKELEINFQEGLTVITGETGAGKSILLGALSLILGQRADTQNLNSQHEKCIVEGKFDISKLPLIKKYLEEHEFDVLDELVLRREISPNGKSRIFINDTPTTLTVLATLSNMLIDLHRQFDTVDLQHQKQQLILFDEIAETQQLANTFEIHFQHFNKKKLQWQLLTEQNKIIKKELDYNQFLYSELETLNLQENELETLENELEILNNSEFLKSSLQKAVYDLNESEQPILKQLKSILQSLDRYTSHSSVLKLLYDRINSVWLECKDICRELETIAEDTQYNPQRIAQINERLDEGNRLLKKHHASQTIELVETQQQLKEKINQSLASDVEEEKLKKELDTILSTLHENAKQLSQKRKKQIESIESHINILLPKVGLSNAKFKIEWNETELYNSGIDKIEFTLDANKTNKFQPLGKAASGGELSRIMLCIKSLQAQSVQMPTMLFDEIDTGISGETAIQVAALLQELAAHHQIICITHLPQIASKGSQHLFIYKNENEEGKIHTSIKALNSEERVHTLSEMISGKNTSDDTLNMVKNLMK